MSLIIVPRSFGSTLLLTPPPLSITIGGTSVVFDEDTFHVSLKLDERWRFQFTVLDYAGTQQFSYRQQVVVTDANLGILFAGFVADVKQDKTNTYSDTTIEHQIDCIDMRGLVDKRTSNWFYANQQAGVIAVHQVQKYLAAEGITVAAALRWDEQLTDWQAGTLTNTVATTNAYDSNLGDGDLELALAGTAVTILEDVTADFATGTLTNMTATGNALVPNATAAIKFSSTNNQAGSINAFTYIKIWDGSYAIGSGDTLTYDMWVDPASPNGSMGVDIVFDDGTTLRDNALNISANLDAQNIPPHPKWDTFPYSKGRWYHRSFLIDNFVGKTVQYVTVAIEGNDVGVYTGWFKNIKIAGGPTFFGSSFNVNPPQQLGANGYSNSVISVVNTYDLTTASRVSSAYSISAVSLVRSSYLAWNATLPTGITSLISYSIDGGTIYYPCTNGASLPKLLAGMNVAGKSIILKEQFGYVIASSSAGISQSTATPDTQPMLNKVSLTLNPSYGATKSDVLYEITSHSNWAAGTSTNVTDNGGATLALIGITRNWDNVNINADQSRYGAFNPVQAVNRGTLTLQLQNGGDAKSRFDFAGNTWQDFTLEIDVQVGANYFAGVNYRTTAWFDADHTYAYLADLTTTGVNLGRCSNNATPTAYVNIGTAPLALTDGDWHHLKVVVAGSNHKVYIDDVLEITATDATFAGAGYVGAHISNSSTGVQKTYFNNFGIQKSVLTGTWVGPAQSIAAAGHYYSSAITWEDRSDDSNVTDTILVESQVDGSTWQTCTNGGAIGNLTVGQSLTGVNLKLRVTLLTSTASTMPAIGNISVIINGQMTATGTRSTAPVGVDTFVRANQAGWGTASNGMAWTLDFGSGTASIASNEGKIATSTGNTNMKLSSTTYTDTSTVVNAQFALGSDFVYIYARYGGSSTYYRVRMGLNTFLIQKFMSSTLTTLASVTPTIATATKYSVRFQVNGSNLQARFWVAGTLEPTTWALTATDSAIASGAIALGANGTGAGGSLVQFDTLVVTLFPDPALSLAPVGSQAGTALVNWNANLPTNTSLLVQTSIDQGATYQTVAAPGNAITGITTQPDPLEDSFESNQANYISTFGNGGSVATWTLDTTHSRIAASGGSDALYLRADNRYAGLTIGINPGIGNPGSPYAFWTNLLADMAAQGLSTLRFQISWRNIELTQGVYTWTVLDDAVSHCNAAGIRILYTIRDAPTWAKDPANGAVLATTEPYYVMSASLAAGFATQVATRYDGNHGHGFIDMFGFNEDFSIHFTPNSDTFTLNGTVTSGVAITSFPITASTVTPMAGTKIYFGTFSSPDVATVSTDVNVGDTTVHVNSFTPGSTYTATQVLKIGYVGTYNSAYPGLYGAADAVTSINKTQPARDFHFAAPVYTAVYNAIRAVNPTVPIGLPCVWWIQPANPGGTPNTPVSNHTASLQTLYTAGVPMDAGTFVDFHYYTNGVDPTIGNNQTNTIGQVMIDFAAVASANGDAGRQIICTEFGWQSDQSTTSSTTIAAGTRTITLASTLGAAIGGTCLIDTVGSGVQETVTITAKTSTTITAVFANAHTATYPVVISQDCAPTGIDGQDERYTEVMTAIQGTGINNQFFFYTLDYNTSGTQTSSLVFWNGSAYTYQPAWTSIATYLAAHPGGSTNNTVTDVDILVDMDQSDAGGMAWRFVDANNFYELAVRDASSPTNPNTVQLYKMVAGVRSAVGPTNPAIRFVRGIPYRVRVTMIGGVITVFFDGVQIATYTDGSPLGAGLCGLRNDTISGSSVSRYYQLRIQPLGQNVSALSLVTKVTLTSTDPTVTPQLLDMQAFVSSPAIGAGTLIPSASYNYTFVDKNFDDLAKQSNYGWFIDQFKALNFQGRQAVPSPWVLSSNTLAQPSDLEADSNLLVEIAGDLYRNRQVLTGVIGTAVFSDSFIGDGTSTSFTLRYPVAPGTIPTITLDGQVQTVALQGATGAQWYYAVGSTTIAQDSSGTVLTDLDTLSISYMGTFTTTVTANNLSAQTALALVEGGSGIVEAVEDVSSRNMTLAAATTYANQLLTRYCITGRTLTYKTYRNGLAVGQIQSVIVPEEFLQDVQLLLRQIDIGMQTQPNKTVLYNYLVNATELPNVGSPAKLLASGLLD